EADGREFDPEEAARLGAPPLSAAETEPKPAPSALSVPPDCVAAAGAVPGDAPAGEAAAGSPLIGTGDVTSPTATAPPGQVSPQRSPVTPTSAPAAAKPPPANPFDSR